MNAAGRGRPRPAAHLSEIKLVIRRNGERKEFILKPGTIGLQVNMDLDFPE